MQIETKTKWKQKRNLFITHNPPTVKKGKKGITKRHRYSIETTSKVIKTTSNIMKYINEAMDKITDDTAGTLGLVSAFTD
jgi:hypothetical protein